MVINRFLIALIAFTALVRAVPVSPNESLEVDVVEMDYNENQLLSDGDSLLSDGYTSSSSIAGLISIIGFFVIVGVVIGILISASGCNNSYYNGYGYGGYNYGGYNYGGYNGYGGGIVYNTGPVGCAPVLPVRTCHGYAATCY